MCGIMCYTGISLAKSILIEGLKRLEYRGYDSAGLAIRNGHQVLLKKSVGRISHLESLVNGIDIDGHSGIAHTRWATHGEPTEVNAHPHTNENKDVFIVHNGIVENYYILKKQIEKKGISFRSDTDTEVLAHLIALNFEGDLSNAVRKTMSQVEGTFGIAVMHKDVPNEIVIARRGSPLVIGLSEKGNFAASDVSAFIRHTNKVLYLQDNELACLKPDNVAISTVQARVLNRDAEIVEWRPEDVELNGYPHFMLKEIYEQPETIRNALRGRLERGEGISKLGGLTPVWDDLKKTRSMIIVACGTSYYAGHVGKYVFEKLTDMDVQVELASELRYRKLKFPPKTFVIALSQSGETADTLAALKEAKRKGARLLGVVNVVGSTISRETEAGIYNHAGPEIGVASTKIFTSQVIILTLMALLLGRHHRLTLAEGAEVIRALEALPEQVKAVLSQANRIETIAEKYHKFNNWLFLGRKYNYPVAMEGALKLKEVSYIHSEGYAAGEMKHGPIALINPQMPTVAIVPRDELHDKMVSNIMEVRSRRGPVIAIATEGDEKIKEVVDDLIEIPQTLDLINPVLAVVPCQLLAYYCARFLHREIDKPRNLAKSVTVE